MTYKEKLKELSCEDLEQKRKNLASFIFTDFRSIDSKILEKSISKLSMIENEIDEREETIKNIFSELESVELIDFEDLANETLNNFYSI